MSFAGTVVNGSIVLDGSPQLPEGSRVDVELVADGDDIGAPPEPFDYQEHLAALREAYAGIKLGLGRPVEEVMADITKEFGLPE